MSKLAESLFKPCKDCHDLDRLQIAEVDADQHTLRRAEFDHGAHVLVLTCEGCHASIVDPSSDVAATQNLPGIDSCKSCHSPSIGSYACATCHYFHPNKERASGLLVSRDVHGMKAVLVGKTSEGQEDMARFPFEQQATIGRGAENTVVIEDASISGKHARIVYDAKESCYFLEDLESLNGTELDGTRVRDRERLETLHVITLANTRDLIFQDLATRVPQAQPSPGPAPPPAPEPQPEPTRPEVVPPPTPDVVPEEAHGTMIEEGGFKLPSSVSGDDAGDGTRIEEGGFKLPSSVSGDDAGEGTRIEEGGFKLPSSVSGDDAGEGTRVEEGGFKLPSSVSGDDAGEGTRVEEGGFKLPSSVSGDDAGDGTRIEEGGFKLPSSVAGDEKTDKKSRSDDDTGEIPRAAIDTDPSGQIKVAFRLDIPDLKLSFTLREGENVVGRGEEAAVRINLPDISRRHAVITINKDKVTVRDEGSSNKTYIDDREIGREPVELLAGDTLIFGDVKASLLRG